MGEVLNVKPLRENQMEKRELEVGDVVQLTPGVENQEVFSGCFLTVEEPFVWGCKGYIQSIGSEGKAGTKVYLRVEWKHMEFVGHAAFISVSNF